MRLWYIKGYHAVLVVVPFWLNLQKGMVIFICIHPCWQTALLRGAVRWWNNHSIKLSQRRVFFCYPKQTGKIATAIECKVQTHNLALRCQNMLGNYGVALCDHNLLPKILLMHCCLLYPLRFAFLWAKNMAVNSPIYRNLSHRGRQQTSNKWA